MGASYLRTFNVAETMRNSWLIGYLMGEQARAMLDEEIRSNGPNVVWKIDFGRSICVDYCFIEECLAPILSNYGESLPDNTVLVVPCRNSSDRESLIRGLGWQRGEPNVYSDKETLDLIVKKKRYCVRVKAPNEPESNALDYVATDEEHLLKALKLIESMGEATVDDVRTRLQWDSMQAVHALEDLKQRRQIFRLPVKHKQTGEDDRYLSLTNILLGAAI